jgi:uncharacterized protein YgiM (DUF1202 family)
LKLLMPKTLRALLGAAACCAALSAAAQIAPAAPDPVPSVPVPAPPAAPPPAEPPAALIGKGVELLRVSDAFLDMHTGPGRGYPIFYVVERGAWVAVEGRRTDWYRVRAEGGQVGWVPRKQLEATLTAAGESKSFRDVLIDDYLARKVEFGAAWGRFKKEPMLKLWLQYRLADTVGLELSGGQVQGLFSGTDFWALSLTSEPWSDKRLSPFFSVGIGGFRNIPNLSLVNAAPVNSRLAQGTLGLRWYLSERFVARLDGTVYTTFVADNRSLEYRSFTAGLAFFF